MSKSLVLKKFAKKEASKVVKAKQLKWNMQAGDFVMMHAAMIDFRLPQFKINQDITFDFVLFDDVNMKYDIILGCNILQVIGLNILNDPRAFLWVGIEVPFMPKGHWNRSAITHSGNGRMVMKSMQQQS